MLVNLEKKGLLFSKNETEEEIMFTKFGDIASIKACGAMRDSEADVINLRKPILLVSPGEEAPAVFSCNLNLEAVDNKMVSTATGRTGGFCTGCSASEADMHGEESRNSFYLNMGADQVWQHFQELKNQLEDQGGDLLEEVVIPSGRGDYRQRLGTKHAPLTTQIEFSKVLCIYQHNQLPYCRPYRCCTLPSCGLTSG